MSDHIAHLLAEALRYSFFRIDQLCDKALEQLDRDIESANRSLGQRRRWMAAK